MKTKQNKKNSIKQFRFTKQSVPIVVLSTITGLLVVTVLIGAFFIQGMWWQQQVEGNGKITTLILQAAEGLNAPAPIDAKTGKVYIPQAKLVLPARTSTAGSELHYRYSSAQDGQPEELAIVNEYGFRQARTEMISAMNLEDTFTEVPALQACLRGYQIYFAPIADTKNPLTFSKKLGDGRTVYVYLDSGCKQRNPDFEAYLKQIDSY